MYEALHFWEIQLMLSYFRNSTPYIFMATMGTAELPALVLTGPITGRYGRKPVITTGCIIITLSKAIQILFAYHINGEIEVGI